MPTRVLVLASCLVLCPLLFVEAAFAQSDTSSDLEARELFSQGRAAYEAGDFDGAIRAFRRAYLLSPRYALLYNIGQAELRAGHDALALESFEGFLRQAPHDDAHYSEVEERTRLLRSMGTTSSASTTPGDGANTQPEAVDTPPDSVTSDANTRSDVLDDASTTHDDGPGIAPWIIVGAGAAALIVGGVLMGVAAGDASKVTDAPDGSSWADVQSTRDGVNTLWGVGLALGAVGLAAAGVGLVWALTGSSSDSSAATARLRLSPMSVSLEGDL